MTKIKICGITKLEDALFAAECGADAVGFVFAESPRRIGVEQAARIVANLPPFLTTVGIFVDEKMEEVRKILRQVRLDALQFHGEEPPDYCSAFRIEAKAIKAVRIKGGEDLAKMADYDVDAFLLDTYVKEKFGGTGVSFDWDLAKRAKDFGRPIILAGGLKAANVGEAIERVRPYGVDASSGVESSPGVKDQKLIKRFINTVREKDAT